MNVSTQQLLQQREQLQRLLDAENYDTDVFASHWQQYQQQLEQYCASQSQADDFETVLADNLQWVTLVTETVTRQREHVGAAILKLQKGKKALQRYDQNS